MPDKTPLELARDLLDRQRAATSQHRARKIASALVERMTPVEIDKSKSQRTSMYMDFVDCPACEFSQVEVGSEFCCNCGKPLVWK